jgi:hypothetical protein
MPHKSEGKIFNPNKPFPLSLLFILQEKKIEKISLGFSFIIFVTLFCPFQFISIFEICKIKSLFVIKNIALYSML